MPRALWRPNLSINLSIIFLYFLLSINQSTYKNVRSRLTSCGHFENCLSMHHTTSMISKSTTSWPNSYSKAGLCFALQVSGVRCRPVDWGYLRALAMLCPNRRQGTPGQPSPQEGQAGLELHASRPSGPTVGHRLPVRQTLSLRLKKVCIDGPDTFLRDTE